MGKLSMLMKNIVFCRCSSVSAETEELEGARTVSTAAYHYGGCSGARTELCAWINHMNREHVFWPFSKSLTVLFLFQATYASLPSKQVFCRPRGFRSVSFQVRGFPAKPVWIVVATLSSCAWLFGAWVNNNFSDIFDCVLRHFCLTHGNQFVSKPSRCQCISLCDLVI